LGTDVPSELRGWSIRHSQYRQLFNPHLFLLAHGRIYSNHGAMTPGACGETADGHFAAVTHCDPKVNGNRRSVRLLCAPLYGRWPGIMAIRNTAAAAGGTSIRSGHGLVRSVTACELDHAGYVSELLSARVPVQVRHVTLSVLRTANGVPAGPREECRQAGVLT
jgi:hypothetical protein